MILAYISTYKGEDIIGLICLKTQLNFKEIVLSARNPSMLGDPYSFKKWEIGDSIS